MRWWLGFLLSVPLCCAQNPGIEQIFNEALTAQQRGDFAAAAAAYERVLALQPDLVPARANLAAVLVQLGRFEEAIVGYRAGLNQGPDNPAVRLNLALAYYKKGDFSSAAGELMPLHRREAADARVATLLGDCFLHLGRYGEAIELLQPVVGAHPENLDAAYILGSALIRSEKLEEGLQLIERAATGSSSADTWLLAASTQLRIGEFARARASAEAAARLAPDMAAAYTLSGIARERVGDEEGAKGAYWQALRKNPNDFDANLHLGSILYELRELDGAQVCILRALKVDPSSMLARYQMALLKIAQDHPVEALADLQAIAQQDPQWLQPHVQLAALYYRLHRPAEGATERKIVDRLMADQQKQDPRPSAGEAVRGAASQFSGPAPSH